MVQQSLGSLITQAVLWLRTRQRGHRVVQKAPWSLTNDCCEQVLVVHADIVCHWVIVWHRWCDLLVLSSRLQVNTSQLAICSEKAAPLQTQSRFERLPQSAGGSKPSGIQFCWKWCQREGAVMDSVHHLQHRAANWGGPSRSKSSSERSQPRCLWPASRTKFLGASWVRLIVDVHGL